MGGRISLQISVIIVSRWKNASERISVQRHLYIADVDVMCFHCCSRIEFKTNRINLAIVGADKELYIPLQSICVTAALCSTLANKISWSVYLTQISLNLWNLWNFLLGY